MLHHSQWKRSRWALCVQVRCFFIALCVLNDRSQSGHGIMLVCCHSSSARGFVVLFVFTAGSSIVRIVGSSPVVGQCSSRESMPPPIGDAHSNRMRYLGYT